VPFKAGLAVVKNVWHLWLYTGKIYYR